MWSSQNQVEVIKPHLGNCPFFKRHGIGRIFFASLKKGSRIEPDTASRQNITT